MTRPLPWIVLWPAGVPWVPRPDVEITHWTGLMLRVRCSCDTAETLREIGAEVTYDGRGRYTHPLEEIAEYDL